MAYAPAKVVTSTGLGGGEIHYMAIIIRVRVTREAAQYPLHYVTYVPSLKLLRPTVFARNVKDAWIDGKITDRLLLRNDYIFFFFKKNTRLNQLMPCDKATNMPYDFHYQPLFSY